MRRTLAVAIAVLFLAAVAALVRLDGGAPTGGANGGDQPLPPGHALLRGAVVDAETEQGLAGVTVKVEHAGGSSSVRTDGRGRYRVVVDAAQPIALTADAPGRPGLVAFGKLCPGERRDLRLALPPGRTNTPPPAPMVLSGPCG